MIKNILSVVVVMMGLLMGTSHAYDCSGVTQYSPGSIATGEIVQNGGNAYQCTVGGWCTVGGPYAPGTGWAWIDAWTDLGVCDGGGSSSGGSSSGGSSSGGTSSGGSSSGGSSSGGTSSGGSSSGGCTSPQYSAGTSYSVGQLVQNVGNNYICNIAGWCSSSAAWAYAPGTGADWTSAWSLDGPCGSGSSGGSSSGGSSSGGTSSGGSSSGANTHKIVGYWHNFDNGSGFIKMRDVSSDYDQINVAFAEPIDNATSGNMGFAPDPLTTIADFKAGVQLQQSKGKKVIISIGGQNGQVTLSSTAARDKFVQTMKSIIDEYGFDGLDVDFEGSSLVMDSNDMDFANPTTPSIVNTISALRTLCDHYGPNFILTFAPETFFVQMGYYRYGGRGGVYLPILHALRDKLTYLYVQQYNSGPIMGLDDVWYTMPAPDFHVAMADMVLNGIPLNFGANGTFPPLPAEKVLIGLPSMVSAGNGFTPVNDVHKVLNYLIKGQSFGGSYTISNPAGYPNFGGLMTWSINWDALNNYEFSREHRQYFDSL